MWMWSLCFSQKCLFVLLSAPFLLWWREILQSHGWLQETETTKGLTVVRKVLHFNFLMILKVRNLLHKKWEQESGWALEKNCMLYTWTGESQVNSSMLQSEGYSGQAEIELNWMKLKKDLELSFYKDRISVKKGWGCDSVVPNMKP